VPGTAVAVPGTTRAPGGDAAVTAR